MPRDYNINISIGGGDRRGAFTGGNVYKTKTTLDSKRFSNDGEQTSNFNLSKVFSVGLGFNLAQKYSELRGAFTENRIAQRRFETGMTFAKYGIGLMVNPVAGGVYAVGDMVYRIAQYNINIQKKNAEARANRYLSGNTVNSGSRYRGDYS